MIRKSARKRKQVFQLYTIRRTARWVIAVQIMETVMNATVIVHSEIMETDHVIIMVIVHSEITETDRVTTETVRREIMATDLVKMVSVNSETTETDHVTTETASREIMATDRREDLATDRRDRKMVIEMAVMKEKTTIIKKVSRVIAAAVIVLEVIETIDRTVRIVQERREDA